MTSNKTNEQLEKVRDAIKNVNAVDEKGRALLTDLEKSIRELLDRPPGQGRTEPIRWQLDAAIRHFELSHPMLTELLADAISILNNAGV